MDKAQGWGFMWCWTQFNSLLLLIGGCLSFFPLHFFPQSRMSLMLPLQHLKHLSCTLWVSGPVCPLTPSGNEATGKVSGVLGSSVQELRGLAQALGAVGRHWSGPTLWKGQKVQLGAGLEAFGNTEPLGWLRSSWTLLSQAQSVSEPHQTFKTTDYGPDEFARSLQLQEPALFSTLDGSSGKLRASGASPLGNSAC